ncbi:hypothetical protein KCU65_g306, partial [Aureobasidium melanogenum]
MASQNALLDSFYTKGQAAVRLFTETLAAGRDVAVVIDVHNQLGSALRQQISELMRVIEASSITHSSRSRPRAMSLPEITVSASQAGLRQSTNEQVTAQDISMVDTEEKGHNATPHIYQHIPMFEKQHANDIENSQRQDTTLSLVLSSQKAHSQTQPQDDPSLFVTLTPGYKYWDLPLDMFRKEGEFDTPEQEIQRDPHLAAGYFVDRLQLFFDKVMKTRDQRHEARHLTSDDIKIKHANEANNNWLTCTRWREFAEPCTRELWCARTKTLGLSCLDEFGAAAIGDSSTYACVQIARHAYILKMYLKSIEPDLHTSRVHALGNLVFVSPSYPTLLALVPQTTEQGRIQYLRTPVGQLRMMQLFSLNNVGNASPWLIVNVALDEEAYYIHPQNKRVYSSGNEEAAFLNTVHDQLNILYEMVLIESAPQLPELSRTTSWMCDPNGSPIAKINYTWDLDAINRMIRLIISIETDYPIYSVNVSVGRSFSTTPLEHSSTQEEDDDILDLEEMERMECECSAEHVGDESEDGEASV